MHVIQCVYGIRGQLTEVNSLLTPCGSWDQTQVVRLGTILLALRFCNIFLNKP